MGDQEVGNAPEVAMEEESDSSYRIIRFPASQLPKKYENFFLAKFLRTLKYGNPLFKLCDNDSFFDNYRRYIFVLLARPRSVLNFAVLPGNDKDVVIGFALTEENILHYVYVIPEVRRQGIAKELCNKPFDTITHVTNTGLTIFSKMKNVKLDPWS